MGFIKKHTSLVNLFSLSILYFFTRLYNIMSLPLFTDEAIYTRWSQIARWDANWRFISLTDGKQPSFVWIDMIIMRFVDDPLLAGRLVSVGAGFLATLGMFFLARELFKAKEQIKNGIFSFTKRDTLIGIVASALYVIYPFSLVYDRMALYDSLVAMFAIWALYFEVLLVRYKRLDIALLLGFVIAGGVLTKTSAFFFIYLLPFSLLLFDLKKQKLLREFFKWVGLVFISVVIAYAFYSILRLSPFFHTIEEKNSIFVYPLKDWLEHPFRFLIGNLRGEFDWLSMYFTAPVLTFLVLFLIFDFKRHIREKLLLLIWFAAPFIALAWFGKTLYPRFIFFMMMPLLVLLALGIETLLERVKRTSLKVLYLVLLFALMIRTDFLILQDFKNAPIPFSDLEQYINGWPAGGGVTEVIEYFAKEGKDKKIFVQSLGTFGSLPVYAVEIYLGDNKNIEKQGMYPIPEQIPPELLEKAKKMPVYIFSSNQDEHDIRVKNWPLELLVEYKKGIGNSKTKLYKVIVK